MLNVPLRMLKVTAVLSLFCVAGILSLLGYWFTPLSQVFLILLGPVFFMVYWLRVHAAVLLSIVPNEPFYNNCFLILPVTLMYFSLLGLQFKTVLRERGATQLLVLIAFLGFLGYVHYLAYHELSLYSSPSTFLLHDGSARNLSLGDEKT